ncbi:MAG: tetratricopeptide repeat protein [bacterium]
MAGKTKQQSERKSERFQNWLTSVKSRRLKLLDSLTELQELVQQMFRETEHEQRLRFLDQATKKFLDSCYPELSQVEQIKLHLWKGHSYEIFGAWQKALTAYERVVKLSDSDDFQACKAEAYRWIGHIHLMQNNWTDAFKSYEESLKLSRECGDEKNEANAYNGIACYYFEQASLNNAKIFWEKALELAEKMNDARLIAQMNNNLGAVANVMGLWEQALAHYSESLPRFEKIGDHRGLAETCHNMAMTYTDAERWAEAGAQYERSYQLAKEIGDVRLQATVKLNRVELYTHIGDFRLAEVLCQQALQTFLNLEDRLGEADVYKWFGVILSENRDWAAAKSHFEKSIGITRKFKNALCEAECQFEYGRMWKLKGKEKSARKHLQLALDLFSQLNAEKEIIKVRKELAEL